MEPNEHLTSVVTAGEAADILRLSRQRVDQLCNAGTLRHRMSGQTRLILLADVEAYRRTARPPGRPKQ